MKEKILFLNMFPDYEPPEQLQATLSQAAIAAADIDPERQSVEVVIECGCYIPKKDLDKVCQELQRCYGLRQMTLIATHPANQLHKIDLEELRDMFVEQNSLARGILAGAQWIWNGPQLCVQLKGNGVKILREVAPLVERQLQQRFASNVHIDFEAGNALEGAELFAAMERMRGEAIESIVVAAPVAQFDKKPVQQESDAIYGKPFKGDAVSMAQLSLDMGTVIVEGKVFAVEHKELKKRNAWVVNFDMTDNRGSVRINRFMESNEAKPILDNIKVGSVIRVQGKLMINQFDNETVMKPFAIMPGSMPKRQDTAVGEKRVELHLHTTMSSMDALTDVGAAVKQAAAWGHRAIAITDHGCAQSFPDAMKAASKAKVAGTEENIKVI